MRRGFEGLAPALCLLMWLLRQPMAWGASLLLPDGATDLMAYAALSAVQTLCWLPAALPLRPWQRPQAAPGTLRWALLALPLGALCQAGFSALADLLPALRTGTALPLPSTPMEWAASIGALCVLPAVCEEIFFRGGVLGRLWAEAQPKTALALGTLLFALMHGVPGGLPAHLSVSLICCLLMLRCGRLLPPMLFHLGYNAAAFALAGVELPALCALLLALPAAAAVLLAGGIPWQGDGRRMGVQGWLLSLTALAAEGAVYFL